MSCCHCCGHCTAAVTPLLLWCHHCRFHATEASVMPPPPWCCRNNTISRMPSAFKMFFLCVIYSVCFFYYFLCFLSTVTFKIFFLSPHFSLSSVFNFFLISVLPVAFKILSTFIPFAVFICPPLFFNYFLYFLSTVTFKIFFLSPHFSLLSIFNFFLISVLPVAFKILSTCIPFAVFICPPLFFNYFLSFLSALAF